MWGDEPASKEIVLNGQTFLVRENLGNFLDRAKDADPPHRGPLWIDALCIDQDNVLERGHQVGLMGDIYTNTQLVISWLGADDHACAQGLDYLLERSPPDLFEELDKATAQSLANIYQHKYWTRTWILQEVVLPQEAEIWIGSRMVKPKILDDIGAWSPAFTGLNVGFQVKARFALEVLKQRIVYHYYVEERNWEMHNFFQLLETIRGTRCKDVRDRLFAIVALMNPEQRKEFHIVPNYTKTPWEICTDLERNIAWWLGPAGPISIADYSARLRQVLEIDPIKR